MKYKLLFIKLTASIIIVLVIFQLTGSHIVLASLTASDLQIARLSVIVAHMIYTMV